LMKGVLKTMFLAKLKTMVAMAMAVMALGTTCLAYRAAQAAPMQGPGDGKPLSELEALRKENELLKLNLQVLLEKIRAQEADLRTFRAQHEAAGKAKAALTRTQAWEEAALHAAQADLARKAPVAAQGGAAAQALHAAQDDLTLRVTPDRLAIRHLLATSP